MKKVIIVGAGIAGLSAGCHLQMNGYDTEIFEMHSQAGGLCAAWKRKDYTIDGCIHWFVGCNPSSYMYKIWNGLVDMKNFSRIVYDEFCSVEHEGKVLRLYGDLEKLNRELKGISPADGREIDNLTACAKRLVSMQNMGEEADKAESITGKISLTLKMVSFFRRYIKWRIPAEKYAGKFKSEQIRNFLVTSLGGESPMLLWLLNLTWFSTKDSGYPIGGAKELAGRIVKRYESLGGRIHYNSKVSKIMVENNIAKGIKLENGETFNGDFVVSAADGRFTIQEMLEGKYRDRHIDKLYYSGKYEPKTSGIHVVLGVAREFDESYKPYVFFDMKNPIIIDGKVRKTLGVTIYNFDPTAAPKGETVLTAIVPSSNPGYWENLRRQSRAEYDRQKGAVAEHVIDELENHFGNIKNNLKMVDVATPATFIRYTNNWNGAFMGWTDWKLFIFRPKKEIKGLKNFYMCGQWVGDAGLPGAAKSGRDIAKIICKKDSKQFKVLSF